MDFMVRLKDIAEIAGVSTATVSYVINNTGNISEETRKKVLRVMEELNYKPNQIARSLKIKKTRTIGVIVEDITIFNAPEIIDGINSYAEKYGFSILLTNLRIYKRIGNNFKEIEKYKDLISGVMDELLSQQVDGIIYIGIHVRDITGLVPDTEKPIVYTYCYTTNEKDFSVNFDDEFATYEMTKYLIELGHRKIALVTGLNDSILTHQRFAGYNRALIESGIQFNPVYIKSGDWEYLSGYKMALELLQLKDRPTAIVAMNDLMAGGVLEACRELKVKVPDDVSVVGFDDRECALYYLPQLTTIRLPLSKMGELSMQKMLDILNKKQDVENITRVKCKLIKRKSADKCKCKLID
jgi:LacI family transcriptional regulator